MTVSSKRHFLVFIFFFFTGLCYGFRYDGFSVVEITPQRNHDVEVVREFAKIYKSDEVDFQFIRPPYRENMMISVIVSRETKKKLVKFLTDESIVFAIVIEDYQKLIDREFAENREAIFQSFFRSRSRNDHTAYLRYQQIEEWLKRKVKEVSYAKFIKFGETFEKRKLFMVKISTNDTLPIVWLDGGIHAREWVATSSALFVIDKLLQNSTEAAKSLNKFQFMIVPLVNPDGYEYSHETFRLWRKNRSKFPFSRCVGVDMNRNFPYEWGGESSSTNPCDDQYRGPKASSETEIKAIIEEMTKAKDKLKLVVSLHAFGQFILQPFSFSPEYYPQNYLDMTSVAIRAAFDVQTKHDTMYLVGRPPDILYPASGSSDDFAVGTLKIPFSYTIELPDQGRHGFTLPPKFIKAVGQQLWDIFFTLMIEISKTSSY